MNNTHFSFKASTKEPSSCFKPIVNPLLKVNCGKFKTKKSLSINTKIVNQVSQHIMTPNSTQRMYFDSTRNVGAIQRLNIVQLLRMNKEKRILVDSPKRRQSVCRPVRCSTEMSAQRMTTEYQEKLDGKHLQLQNRRKLKRLLYSSRRRNMEIVKQGFDRMNEQDSFRRWSTKSSIEN